RNGVPGQSRCQPAGPRPDPGGATAREVRPVPVVRGRRGGHRSRARPLWRGSASTGLMFRSSKAVPDTTARWRGVMVYLALAFGLSWTAQIAIALPARGSAEGFFPSLVPSILVVALFLMWPPAVGA